MARLQKGTIKALVRVRGFGFVATSDGADLFFHRDAVVPFTTEFEDMREGQLVEFIEERSGDKGRRAGSVMRARMPRATAGP